MRRSSDPRVRSQGEILFEAQDARARIVNLSRGGLCGRGELPSRTDEALTLRLDLADGAPPMPARARLAWVAPEADTFGLCFVDLSGEDRARLSAVVDTADAPARVVRLRLDEGPVLRAEAAAIDERGAIIGAELPWLRLSAAVRAEIEGQTHEGWITWVGMDVAPSGAARLRMHVEFAPRERRDITLPYFSPEAASWTPSTHDEPPSTALVVYPRATSTAMARVGSLVRLGERRRMRMAILRVAAGLLALSALFLFARALRQPAPAPPPSVIEQVAEPTPGVEPVAQEPRAEPVAEPPRKRAKPRVH